MKKILDNNFLKKHADIIRSFNYPDQRCYLIVKNAWNSYTDVDNGQHISNLGDLLNFNSLQKIRNKMLEDPIGNCIYIGQKILQEKPRIRQDLQELIKLPKDTFGYQYSNWMVERSFDPSGRPIVTYVPEFELAYIQQRYKEIHDFLHVILGLDSSVEDEILLKWFELVQMEFPSTALAAFAGGFKIELRNKRQFICYRLPKVLRQANQSKFIMNINYEDYFDKNIDDLRKDLNIRTN